MFRHSEVHAILRRRQLEEEELRDDDSPEINHEPINEDVLTKGELDKGNMEDREVDEEENEDEEGYLDFLRQEAEEMKRSRKEVNKKMREEKWNGGDVSLCYDDEDARNGERRDDDGSGEVELAKRDSERAMLEQQRQGGRKRIVYDDDNKEVVEQKSRETEKGKKVFLWPIIGGCTSGTSS